MAVPALVLDHVVIGCATLEQGAAYLRGILGVDVPAGGRHARMGTHNLLMCVGDTAYLELIAIDPEAPPPGRPRWFALDDSAQQARLAERPRPIAWVAGTRDIGAALAASPELGRAVEMTRGDLVWRVSARDDGALPQAGALPVLIEWPPGPHPSAQMADLGVRLERIIVAAADEEVLAAQLKALGAAHLVTLAHGRSATAAIELEMCSRSGARVTLR
jgi:glyoxalase-like protein